MPVLKGKAVFTCPLTKKEVELHDDKGCLNCDYCKGWGLIGRKPYLHCSYKES